MIVVVLFKREKSDLQKNGKKPPPFSSGFVIFNDRSLGMTLIVHSYMRHMILIVYQKHGEGASTNQPLCFPSEGGGLILQKVLHTPPQKLTYY